MKKLFVAGLSYDLTNEQLSEHFAQFGQIVSAQIIMDRNTGRSKGFGFVEMNSDEEAQQAMEKLNNTEFAGRTIVVNEARPMEDRPSNFQRNDNFSRGGRDDRRGGGGGDNRSKRW